MICCSTPDGQILCVNYQGLTGISSRFAVDINSICPTTQYEHHLGKSTIDLLVQTPVGPDFYFTLKCTSVATLASLLYEGFIATFHLCTRSPVNFLKISHIFRKTLILLLS